MGIDLGGILRGVTAAREGYVAGQQRKAALERQQQQQDFENTVKLLTLYATLNKPDAIAIHKAERQYDAANPTVGEQASMLRAKKYRPGSSKTGANQDQLQAQRSLSAVRGQLADTERDLANDRRELPTLDPQIPEDAPEVDRIQGELPELQARADSLGGVRDSLAAVVQGQPQPSRARATPIASPSGQPVIRGGLPAGAGPAPGPIPGVPTAPAPAAAPPAPAPSPQQGEAAQAFAALNAKAARLAQQGVPAEKVRAALAQDIAAVARYYGLTPGGQPPQ